MKDKKIELMKNYDKIIKEYGGYRRKPWPILKDFMNSIKNEKVLDIGAGTCSTTKILIEKGNTLFALDFSFEALKRAPKNALKICGDVANLPIKENTFKIIMAISVLHHLNKKDRLNVLTEIKGILISKGKVFFSVWKKDQDGFKGKKSDIMVPWGKYKRFYHLFSEGELEKLAKEAGFRILTSISDEKNYFIICQA